VSSQGVAAATTGRIGVERNPDATLCTVIARSTSDEAIQTPLLDRHGRLRALAMTL
jgi:hypothetical protein